MAQPIPGGPQERAIEQAGENEGVIFDIFLILILNP